MFFQLLELRKILKKTFFLIDNKGFPLIFLRRFKFFSNIFFIISKKIKKEVN